MQKNIKKNYNHFISELQMLISSENDASIKNCTSTKQN